jgi:hypothetical protein
MADWFSPAPRTLNLEVGMSSKAEWVADLCGLTLGVPSPVIRTRGCLPRAG